VIRGAIDQGRFSVFYHRDASLTAVDSINRPGDQIIAPSRLAAGGDGEFEALRAP
jgi:3-phenylpropionate/trans-cinnamate dioxygenase ferredoxin reductase subunit